MSRLFRIPLTLTPQSEGGYTVTSPQLPGLVTEGDSVTEALSNVEDALLATIELYEDTGKVFPADLVKDPDEGEIRFDLLLPTR